MAPVVTVRRIVTEYSVYELNEEDNLVRRMHGLRRATMRQGEDGVWQSFESVVLHPAGMIIVWGDNPDGSKKTTITSAVLREEYVNADTD